MTGKRKRAGGGFAFSASASGREPVDGGYSSSEEGRVETITELSIVPDAAPAAEAALVVPRLPNTLRLHAVSTATDTTDGRTHAPASAPASAHAHSNGYRPTLLAEAQQALHARNGGRSVAELEAAERARTTTYGLSGVRAVVKSEPGFAADDGPAIKAEESDGHDLARPDQNGRLAAAASSRREGVRSAVASAFHPPSSTLEEYEAMPVASFGMAMLRGMGYVPPVSDAASTGAANGSGSGAGSTNGSSNGGPVPGEAVQKRRPDFLGLGATELPQALKPAAGKNESEGRRRARERLENRTYVPLVKVNRRTGEVVDDNPPAEAACKDKRVDEDTPSTRPAAADDRAERNDRKERDRSRRNRSRDHDDRRDRRRRDRSDERDSKHEYRSSHRNRDGDRDEDYPRRRERDDDRHRRDDRRSDRRDRDDDQHRSSRRRSPSRDRGSRYDKRVDDYRRSRDDDARSNRHSSGHDRSR